MGRQFATTAITLITLTIAHLTATTDRAGLMAGSSWALALGTDGVGAADTATDVALDTAMDAAVMDMGAAATDAAGMGTGVLDTVALDGLDTAERGLATVAAHDLAAEQHLADLAAAEPAADSVAAAMPEAAVVMVAADIAKLN